MASFEPYPGVDPRLIEAAKRASEIERDQEDPSPQEAEALQEQLAQDFDADRTPAMIAAKVRQEEARANHEEQKLDLRKSIARAALWFVGVQLGVANLFFGWYLWHNRVDPSAQIMIAWLTSSVVEVIGIIVIIARSLFPGANGDEKVKADESKD